METSFIQNLIKEGKYDEVMNYINMRNKELPEVNDKELNLTIPNISVVNVTYSEINDNPHEATLDLNEEEERLFLVQNYYKAVGDTRPLDQELHLLEEEVDLDKIEEDNIMKMMQLNENFLMNIEDELSKRLQDKIKQERYPFINEVVPPLSAVLHSLNFLGDDVKKLAINPQLYLNDEITNFPLIDDVIINDLCENLKIRRVLNANPNPKVIQYELNEILNTFDFDDYISKVSSIIDKDVEVIKESNVHTRNTVTTIQSKCIFISITKAQAVKESITSQEEEIIIRQIKVWTKHLNMMNNEEEESSNLKKYNEGDFKNLNRMLLDIYSNKDNHHPVLSNSMKDVISYVNLIEINLSSHGLVKIPFVSNLPNLRLLNLEDNKISKIENLHHCKYATSINLNKNMIRRIENLDSLSNLERLSLNGNHIECVENLSMNRKLKSLSLGRNKIKEIENILNEILLIEELTLCENEIKFLPEISFPYLRYLDLNENKIKSLNKFFCPSLEKLFLKDNKIVLNEGNVEGHLKFCAKLREVDISFNKVEYFSMVILLVNYNHKLESINFVNNPCYVNLLGVINLGECLMRIFPKLKIVNNETLRTKTSIKKNRKEVNILNYLVCYFEIFQQQSVFMKNFNAIYLSSYLFNRFNFNSSGKLDTEISKSKFIQCLNDNYFNFKKCHLEGLLSLTSDKPSQHVSSNVKIQYKFLKFLYDFKHKVEYIKASLPKMKENFTRLKKVKLIQRNIKGYLYYKDFKNKRRNIMFIDEDSTNADHLVNFFQNEVPLTYKEDLDYIKDEAQSEHNDNDKGYINSMPHVKAVEKEMNDLGPDVQINNFKQINNITETNPNSNLMNMNEPVTITPHDEVNPNDEVQYPDVLLNKSFSSLTRCKVVDVVQTTEQSKPKRKFDVDYKVISLNELNKSLPKLDQSSKIIHSNSSSVVLPIIKSNHNVSITTSSSATMTNNKSSQTKKSSKLPLSLHNSGRLLPTKLLEGIRLLEEECKITITRAKEEWKFTNPQAEFLLENKIKKQYKKKIEKLIGGGLIN